MTPHRWVRDPVTVDARVPAFLGRVLTGKGDAVGTCFQVAPGVLVTAWHVLDALGAGQGAATVGVDALNGAAGSAVAEVVRVDPVHDLAVLRRAEPLAASVAGVSVTDGVALRTEVVVTGVSTVDDLEHDYRSLDAPGQWAGGTTRDDQVSLGRLSSSSVMRGMSGAPVRRVADDVVVGVVSGRYNSADGWLWDSVWVARTEHLEPLLAGLAEVPVDGRLPLGAAVEDVRRRPWMAPPLDRMVERPELASWLVAALTAPGSAEVALTTALQGAGGFGKTQLATWVSHLPEIDRRYPGGLLWVVVGQDVRGADLAERINDLTFVLCGQRPAVFDPDTAGAELGRLLDEHREPVLLIVDDVWDESQLRPFRSGGRSCTRLVTTRIPDVLPAGAQRIAVDAMSHSQARLLVTDRVAGLSAGAADRLASLAGRWPVLLNLVNGALQRRVQHGQSAAQAAVEIAERLADDLDHSR